ncbi:MAG: hypothetical protein JNM17_41150 [Archangium sp.]|nr:hypothetical protein [Archangium sp.]
MKSTFLPLALGMAAWFLLAAMVGVTFQSSTPAHPISSPTATVVKKPLPATQPQLVMNE